MYLFILFVIHPGLPSLLSLSICYTSYSEYIQNYNYELIYRSFERISMKEIMLLSGLILGLPFFSMFIVVDQRFSTQFSNSIPHYQAIHATG